MHPFQADFGVEIQIVAIATQGRQGRSEWVSQYTLSYSLDGRQWFPYDAFTRVPIVSALSWLKKIAIYTGFTYNIDTYVCCFVIWI